jgi:hypothetical protein
MTATKRHDGHHGTNGETPPQGLSRVEHDVHGVLTSLERLSTDLSMMLRESVDRRPWASLGAGFLAGYVLGGGLTLRLTTLLLGTAGRAVVAGALANAVSDEQGR